MTASAPVAAYALALGDDALVLSQRCGQWITRSPQLEEDVAIANIGLDLLGQARTLLAYAGTADGRSEDDLAYLRDADAFTNVQLVELPNTDFAVSMARLLVFAAYQRALYSRLASSTDETLSGVAAKAVKEVTYHLDHASEWVLRLGDGTDESHHRMQVGLETVWPHVDELFDGDFVDPQLVADGVAVDPSSLRDEVLQVVRGVVTEATLTLPDVAPEAGGGRRGEHTPDLAEMLDEMQGLHRAHPGATW
ncbi:1,2-phenylacetyl-CoA epoxidase subunit PaaC [Angustibacter sp. Root456]|uniref:1,2-phenylacetyl-CoA epoxidase subunit PaaC n=1 Tax=Angustibacter sp. Root456 TaxID=1736539 RepID=UPI0007022735|nr:1,2-phenylacetyl-CoA epoxidase subunit PaaC [Angustibacter sp. Root456]KQX61748.1 phenylacetic acid degradation protein [Angustibacter sp. Root456]